MMKRKVNVNMEGFNLFKEGTVVYANELILRLMNYKDIEIRGTIPRSIRFSYNPQEYTRFAFPITTTRFPEWLVSSQSLDWKHKLVRGILRPLISRHRIFSYNDWVADTESDVFLFFLNGRAPNLPTKGNVITCVHDVTPFRVPQTFTENFLESYKRNFENLIGKSAKIITDSDFSKRDIIDYAHIDENRIEVVYCGVNAEEFAVPCPAPENVRAKYNLPEKYILYFGTCGPRKNVESVIRSYARLPEAVRREYALVITNPQEATKSCAAENVVTPCYIDGVSAEDKAAVYQMASVLVWPSLYEGFGLPIVEAQAAGTPVVCSNVTSLPEVAGDAAVLVEPKDTEAMAAAIERCLYDEPFRQDLITKGHRNVRRFNWDDSARRLHDIIVTL
ncbi:MAG: glycosyltransferase family 4 protein [Fretibacterium sp.]|nr:glycosyltransferase family 4 protein [Fretibacterium sp.]